MHKVVILIEAQEDEAEFEQQWATFLHWAERMPGLRKEVTSRVENILYGKYPCSMVHELYFDTLEDAENALKSQYGSMAGYTLQKITEGHITLFLAEHLEDTIENIQKSVQASQSQGLEKPETTSDETDERS